MCYDSGGGKRIAYQNLEPSAFDLNKIIKSLLFTAILRNIMYTA